MTPIEPAVRALVEQWAQTGFNGVRLLQCRMDTVPWSRWEEDGLSREEFEKYRQDYACCIIKPDDTFADISLSVAHRYYSFSFELALWAEDVRKALEAACAGSVKVKWFPGTHEFEVRR